MIAPELAFVTARGTEVLPTLLLLQATATPASGPPDLRVATRGLDCPDPAAEGEVVVCANRGGENPDRLTEGPVDRADPQRRFRLGSATITPQVETDRFGLATPTVRVTTPF